MSLSLATLEAVGLMKLDALRRRRDGDGDALIRLVRWIGDLNESDRASKVLPFRPDGFMLAPYPLEKPLLGAVSEETEDVERFKLLLLAPRFDESGATPFLLPPVREREFQFEFSELESFEFPAAAAAAEEEDDDDSR